MTMNIRVLLSFLGGIYFSDAYRILLLYPIPTRSLNHLGERFADHLLKAGHEVTFITNYPRTNDTNKNLRQIDISSNILNVPITADEDYNIKNIMEGQVSINDAKVLQDYAVECAILTLEHENVRKLLEDPNEHFDAVVVNYYEVEIYSGIASLYNCPMIWSYSMGPYWQALRLIDEPTNPAYTANYLSSNVVPFTFKQRLEELWAQIKWTYIKWMYTMPAERKAYVKYFKLLLEKRGRVIPNYDDLIYNASLIFINDHYTLGNIPKAPENLKLVGGYHIETPTKPLPQEHQKIMDDAKDGVIYFSMGSAWNSKDMPNSIIQGLVKMFGELKQTVIWKYEENLPNLPNNLKILKWAPQQSILAHTNCKIFITHGGHLSSTEAIHYGVPIIGLPIYLDQFVNMNKAAAKGFAITVPLNYDLPNGLRDAVQTMLTDSRYKQKAKELSAIYHDRLVQPGDEIVHWVTHVIRTGGARHLRSPALQTPFYQKMYLDLAAVIIVIIVVVFIAVKKVFGMRRKVTMKQKKN